MGIDQIRNRKSYAFFVGLIEAHSRGIKATCYYVYEWLDQTHRFGSIKHSIYADESLKQAFDDNQIRK